MTKIFFPSPHKGKSRDILKLTKKNSRCLIEIVTDRKIFISYKIRSILLNYSADCVRKRKRPLIM